MRSYLIMPLFLMFCSVSLAQESITITSYYPSPYGVYNELRLYPNASPSACNANNRGAMYYNSVNNEVRVCNGTDWQVVGPTPSGAVMFFNLGACPAGWTELAGARGRYIVGLPVGGTLAATVGTALSNTEDRATGQHTHTVSDPGHMHSSPVPDRSTANSSTPPGATYYTPLGLNSGDTVTGSNTTGITVGSAGAVAGTNSPYIQLLACQKD